MGAKFPDRGLSFLTKAARLLIYSSLRLCFFFLVSVVVERPWWPMQSPNKGRKKKIESLEERGIRSSLLILDLKDSKLYDSGKQEEGKMVHQLHVLGVNDD